MSIDLAWKSLSQTERDYIMGYIRTLYVYPHLEQCRVCDADNPCGAIIHIFDLLEAMQRYAN